MRVEEFRGWFYVLARNGKRWKALDRAKGRNEALLFIEEYHNSKDVEWALRVKQRDFFACIECGIRDRELLESHHIKPKEQFPELRHKLDNGECDCLWRHALQHKNNPVVMNMILLRLVKVLTKEPLSKCQKALLS